jgi:hypothetical protein
MEGAMPKRTAKRTLAKNQADRVRALLGGTPPAALRKKPMPLEAELRARAKIRRERWALVSRHSEAILKPLHDIIAADKAALKAARTLNNFKPAKRQKLPRPAVPKIESITRPIRSGSILTLVSPPYDQIWTAGSGVGQDDFGDGSADASTGEFIASCQVNAGGSEWGGAGVAMWFQPVADNTYVRFGPFAPGFGTWDDRSWGWATAHTNGSIGILIESWDLNGQSYTRDVDNQWKQWGDGIGSYSDEHGYYEQTPFFFPDQYFWAVTSRYYRVWTYADVWCDGSGGGHDFWGSTAFGNLACNLGFCQFQQWT